jgi:hypothetical protein
MSLQVPDDDHAIFVQLDTLGERVDESGDAERRQTDEHHRHPRQTPGVVRHAPAGNEEYGADSRHNRDPSG